MAVAGWGVVAGAAGSGFRVGWGMAGVVWFLFFGGFLLVLSGGGWALGYHSVRFRHFSDVS